MRQAPSSARVWGIDATTSSGLHRLAMLTPYAVTAGLVALAIYCALAGEPVPVSKEDGLVEWATCVCFGLCGVVGLVAAKTRWPELARNQRVVLLVFTAAAFMAIGEELSWGQRWLGFAPPETMRSGGGSAVQMGHNDVTWHNLSFELGPLKFSLGGMLFGVPMVIGLGLYGIWLPLQLKRGDKAHRLARKAVDRLGLFVPPVHLGVLMTVGAAAFHTRDLWPGVESREFKELLVAMVMAFVVLHAFFRGEDRAGRLANAGALVGLAAGLALSVWAVLP
jgi:hypothetical protein